MRKQRKESPDLQSMLDDFKMYFRNEGFITREHEEERYASAIETLTKFFDEDKINNLLPKSIEEKFEFCEDGVKINGRYDLVNESPEGSQIIDFKTSSVNDQKDADKRVRESTQMKIYALAWLEKYGEIPTTTLFFIENNFRGTRKFSQKDLEKTREMILEVAKGIRKNDFTAKPDARQCKYCPFKNSCPDSMA
jgi:DNA helicase-2/ATP-dependent DNA helicase PcrA